MGQPIEMLAPEGYHSQHINYRAECAGMPQTRPMGVGRDLFGLRKNGSEVPIEVGLSLIKMNGQTLILNSIVEITQG